VGIATIRAAWRGAELGKRPKLKDIVQPAAFVPETALALGVLDALKESSTKLAIVVDEHGGTAGLITLTDIVEAIVGVIPQPGQGEEPGAVQDAEGNWLIDGLLPIYELKDLLDLDELPDEGEYTTLGGFIVHQLEHIPAAGEEFEYASHRFRVVDMDGQRVDKVMVSGMGDSEVGRPGDSG
jgi:putative hemolysin